MTDHPVGKGYFVWQRERCAGNNPWRMAEMAAAAGLKWVSFKIHNGILPRNGDLTTHVQALRNVGVESWGWGYCYGYAPEKESRIAIARCAELSLAGYMLNAEVEYKRPGAAGPAAIAMNIFRVEAPRLSIGLCSYRFPTLHQQLPWAQFLAWCRFHNPQVYWLESNGVTQPTLQLMRSLQELRARKNLPVIPLGVSSPNDANTWRPTVPQLDNFYSGVVRGNLGGHGWWSWEHAERESTWWMAIARHGAGVPTPPPALTNTQAIRGRVQAIRDELSQEA